MKIINTSFCVLLFFSHTLFGFNNACDYAGSNIDYVKSQTIRALEANDLNTSKFFAYKALNAIEKSRKQLEACDCEYAVKNIYEGLDNLKKATRTTSLESSKILLNRALENTLGSLEAIDEHELHKSNYASDVLAMNTVASKADKVAMKRPNLEALHQRIDNSLVNFQNSLDEVVASVPCKEALSFASKIHGNSEQELLKNNLTEAKKYYNLRTKAIAAEALKKLNGCTD
ncbi:hypothetical protein [Spongiimicrobium sp. 3-5]|uniref:hypothetical protein n=1 Tax=Spongiimicrobium sp. 3-5 TaxID=3332596 RepID=UPI003980FD46